MTSANQGDGARKYVTIECVTCPYAIRDQLAERLIAVYTFPKKHRDLVQQERRLCAWGRSVKTLVEHEKPPRRCGLIGSASPGISRWLGLLALPVPSGQATLFDATANNS